MSNAHDRERGRAAKPLEPKHVEILFCIAEGQTAAEIAKEVGLPVHRVNELTSQILYKLNARNRAHAVAIAYHEGILTPRKAAAA